MTRAGLLKLPRSLHTKKLAAACHYPLDEFSTHNDLHSVLTTNITPSALPHKDWKPFVPFLIDTVRVVIAVQHQPLLDLTAGNVNVKRNGFKYLIRCPKSCATVQVISRQNGAFLILEFSIPKFTTGQNLVGHIDVHKGCEDCIKKALKLLNIIPTQAEEKAITRGEYRLNRVDVTAHVDCGTAEHADALMLALRHFIVSFGNDVSMYGRGTLYVGQHSKRRSLKIYRKLLELMMKNHQIPDHVYGCKFLTRKAESLVRLELTFRGKELTRLKLVNPLAWNENVAKALMLCWVQQLQGADGRLADVAGIDQLSSPPRHNSCRLLRTKNPGGGDEGNQWHVTDNHSRTGQ